MASPISGVQAAGSTPSSLIPCPVQAVAVVANTGNVILNANTLVDSYQSSAGAYGGSNVGAAAVVEAATSVTNNGGVVKGIVRKDTPAGLSVIPVPAGATPLPLGSGAPGSLNINIASQSITLAPGNYVAANINVNAPGAINVSPAGPVNIWVTGSLNLGGNENLYGIPENLTFLVTSSASVNVNSGGAMFGTIYAPSSSVNIDSTVFGSVVGGSISLLNSGAAVHFDQSSACPQAIATPVPAGATPLPAPPTQLGCYAGTLNGWLQVQCSHLSTEFPGFQNLAVSNDGLSSGEYTASGTTHRFLPLVYGQVETTIVSVDSESDSTKGPNRWSIQNNTNQFVCADVSGDASCAVQFAVVADGEVGKSAVCVVSADGNTGVYNDTCVTANGQNISVTQIPPEIDVTTRVGHLKAFDFANVAGYSFTGANSQKLLATVAQFSWVSSQDVVPSTETDVPNLIPGLYAVVAPDQHGLAGNWQFVTGGIMGEYNSSTAQFTGAGAEVDTRILASSCSGDVSASGPTCPGAPTLALAQNTFTTAGVTKESDNLTLIQTPTISYPNVDLAELDIISSTNASGSNATCLSSVPNYLFIKDNEGDNGGVNSNVGGVPYWESPDIFVVPADAGAPDAGSVSGDLELTAGSPYDVYLQVHNDFGCTDVTGPISVLVDLANPDMGFANWQPVTTGSASGQYIAVGATGAAMVPANGAAILGPFSFTPDAGGHRCVLAAIAADGESTPDASASGAVLPPAYTSNQIAQRNVQISDQCSYSVTNSYVNGAGLPSAVGVVFGISVIPAIPAPGAPNGPAIQLTFSDPNGVWAAVWGTQVQNNQFTVMASNPTSPSNITTVTLISSYVALESVPLPSGQSPTVTLNINPQDAPVAPTVDISTILTDAVTGNIVLQNGGSCTSTATVIAPPR